MNSINNIDTIFETVDYLKSPRLDDEVKKIFSGRTYLSFEPLQFQLIIELKKVTTELKKTLSEIAKIKA